jgi:3-oxoacyl-[acyl-carrier-protein] synthase II
VRKPDYQRRVVVTGLGVVSPVGNDVPTAWGNLIRGQSGLAEITKFDVSRYEAKAAVDGPQGHPSERDEHALRRLRR